MENIYKWRLLKFANHISQLNVEETEIRTLVIKSLEDGIEYEYTTTFTTWMFNELPSLFPLEWTFNHEEDPVLLGIEDDADFIAGIFDFFKIQPQEFISLFGIKYQKVHRRGGMNLKEPSSGDEIAKGIFQFVKNQAKRS